MLPKILRQPREFWPSLRSRSVLLIPAPLLFVWLDRKYCVPPDKAANLGQRYPLDYLRLLVYLFALMFLPRVLCWMRSSVMPLYRLQAQFVYLLILKINIICNV